MPRSDESPDKLSAAVSVLNRVRTSLLDEMADQVLAMADDFAEGGFQVAEFLEMHGSRLHFLCLMISQFEMLRDIRRSAASDRAKASERRPRRRDESARHPGAEEPPPKSGEETGTDL